METQNFVQPKIAIDYHTGDSLGWTILNRDVWSMREIEGYQYLFTSGQAWQRIMLPMEFELSKGIRYWFDIRFKANTFSEKVRLMLTDINTIDSVQAPAIWIQNIPNNTWIRAKGYFTCQWSNMKFFMLSSTDFTGKGSYICFDWIRIGEALG